MFDAPRAGAGGSLAASFTRLPNGAAGLTSGRRITNSLPLPRFALGSHRAGVQCNQAPTHREAYAETTIAPQPIDALAADAVVHGRL